MSIYKACDIRGPVTQLSPELYRSWGRILGSRLEGGSIFPVGGDVRLTSPAFREAFIEGLISVGLRAVDLGTLPTPMVYFARRHLQAPGCAMVTASHNPPDINGLKWMVGDLPPNEEEVQSLRKGVDSGEMGKERGGGIREKMDISPAYREWLWERWAGGQGKGKIIVDPGTGFGPADWAWEDRRNYQDSVYSQLDKLRVFGMPIYMALPWKFDGGRLELLDTLLRVGFDYGRAHLPAYILQRQRKLGLS